MTRIKIQSLLFICKIESMVSFPPCEGRANVSWRGRSVVGEFPSKAEFMFPTFRHIIESCNSHRWVDLAVVLIHFLRLYLLSKRVKGAYLEAADAYTSHRAATHFEATICGNMALRDEAFPLRGARYCRARLLCKLCREQLVDSLVRMDVRFQIWKWW